MDPRTLRRHFARAHVLVVGDVMLDEYIFAEIERMSPESPKTPVILMRRKEYVPGGAANVANNVRALGGQATLVGVIGDDHNGEIVRSLLRKVKIRDATVTTPSRPTTTKTRVFENRTQITRIDSEDSSPLSPALRRKVLASIRKQAKRTDMVILSDYAKGVLGTELMKALVQLFGRGRIVADFKPRNAPLVRGVRAITPNVKEAERMTGTTIRSLAQAREAARMLARKLRTDVVLTMGHRGAVLSTRGASEHRVPARRVRSVDVTGAGDTFTAALALGLSVKLPILEAAKVANRLAAASVSKLGTATVSLKDL